jgi:hypothetical protein
MTTDLCTDNKLPKFSNFVVCELLGHLQHLNCVCTQVMRMLISAGTGKGTASSN